VTAETACLGALRLATIGALIVCGLATGCGGGNNNSGQVTELTGHQIVTGSPSTVAGGAISSSTAACPSGKVAIGGGYTTGNSAANVFDSFPAANGSGWTVTMKNENLVGGPITMSPVAVCVDRPAGYEIRSTSADLSKSEVRAVSASCTDLTLTLIGGGYGSGDSMVSNFSSSFDPAAVTSSGVVAPTKWVSSFRSNYSVPASSGVDTYAICIANSAVSAAYLASPTATVGARSNSTLTQACDATTPQTTVAAGGVTADVSHAATFDTSPPGAGSWTAVVHNPQSNVFNPASLNASLLLVCVAAVP
jgi:mucin-19